MSESPPSPTGLSVLIPVYNEEESLQPLLDELKPVLELLGQSWEIVFVDDGSTDTSCEILRRFHDADKRIKVIRFARNFGQQRALTAGLRYTAGAVVILMDADMQQPPEHIPEFLAKMSEGYDIVYGRRVKLTGPLYRRIGSRVANLLIQNLTGLNMRDCAGNYMALSERLVRRINMYQDETRHLGSLFAWLSYGRCGEIDVMKRERTHGESKYNVFKLAAVTMSLIFSLTARPLKLATYAGVLSLLLSAIMGARWVYLVSAFGWRSGTLTLFAALLVTIMSVQLLSMGLLGEYIARIYGEVRDRPRYVIAEVYEDGETKEL